jgi:hypothetical protein
MGCKKTCTSVEDVFVLRAKYALKMKFQQCTMYDSIFDTDTVHVILYIRSGTAQLEFHGLLAENKIGHCFYLLWYRSNRVGGGGEASLL